MRGSSWRTPSCSGKSAEGTMNCLGRKSAYCTIWAKVWLPLLGAIGRSRPAWIAALNTVATGLRGDAHIGRIEVLMLNLLDAAVLRHREDLLDRLVGVLARGVGARYRRELG